MISFVIGVEARLKKIMNLSLKSKYMKQMKAMIFLTALIFFVQNAEKNWTDG
jgi:hypothetical protein